MLNPTSISIREERPDDFEVIRALNFAAFGRHQEGGLVDALRANGGLSLSLVATIDERLVGHILYSPVSINGNGKEVIGVGLGPMAVVPELQRKGIGAELIRAGNENLKRLGCPSSSCWDIHSITRDLVFVPPAPTQFAANGMCRMMCS